MKLYNKILIISVVVLVIPTLIVLIYFTDQAEKTGDRLLEEELITNKNNLMANLEDSKKQVFIRVQNIFEQSDTPTEKKLEEQFDLVESSSDFSQMSIKTEQQIKNKQSVVNWKVEDDRLAVRVRVPIYDRWDDLVEDYWEIVEYIPQEQYLSGLDQETEKFAIYQFGEEKRIIKSNIYDNYGEKVVEIPEFESKVGGLISADSLIKKNFELQGDNYDFIFFPLREGDRLLGAFALGVGRETTGGIITVIKNGIRSVTVIGLLLAVLSTFVISRLVVDPINKIKEFSQRVISGQIDSNLELEREDELGNLAHNINSMVEKLNKRMQAETSLREELAEQNEKLNDAFSYTTDALARAAEADDKTTGNHIRRVNEYSKLIAEDLGLSQDFVNKIYTSAQMHDVGKIHVPNRILNKTDDLTDEEFATIQEHTVYGAEIIGDSDYLDMAAKIALNHHECFDGSGYPHQKQGEEIPLAARIVKLTDIYDALRSPRPYKPAFSHEKTYQIIVEGDGRVEPSHFDPEVHASFIRLDQKFDQIYQQWI
ncbi:MAG: HD domain-containing protein [Halanaerobacter sp.]